jgi:hypothetical protein
MDKKVFLIDKSAYPKHIIFGLTEKDLEEWVMEEDYDDNYTILKLDGNAYQNARECVKNEFLMSYEDADKEYYIISFGF